MAYYASNWSEDVSNVLPGALAGVALAVGELVYRDSSGVWQLADQVADESGSRKDAEGVMVQTAIQYQRVSPVRIAKIRGYTGQTIGAKMYLSDTAGGVTETEPTTNIRQIVGIACSATEIAFEIHTADEEVGSFANEVGTVNTGVTAVERGYGKHHTTALTIAQVNALTVADNSALCDGYKLYTFPAGAICINSVSMSMAVTLAEDTTNTPEAGLGNVEGSDTQATLGADDAGCENILGPATLADCAGTAKLAVQASALALLASAAHEMFFNIAATWADTAGTDLTGDIAGTVIIDWTLLTE